MLPEPASGLALRSDQGFGTLPGLEGPGERTIADPRGARWTTAPYRRAARTVTLRYGGLSVTFRLSVRAAGARHDPGEREVRSSGGRE
jgi:hypothetical protein